MFVSKHTCPNFACSFGELMALPKILGVRGPHGYETLPQAVVFQIIHLIEVSVSSTNTLI